jgi:hypothetical protein
MTVVLAPEGTQMAKLQPQTWSRMRRAWSVAFVCLALPCVKAVVDHPATLPLQFMLLAAGPMLLACFPLIAELNRRAAARRANQFR